MLLNILKGRNDGQLHKTQIEFVADDDFLGRHLRQPIVVDAEYQVIKKDVHLVLNLTYFVETKCDLCCEDAVYSKELQIEELIKYGQDDECYTYSGDSIELDKILNEGILLSLPSQILCKEDCKGLCPICGANRNTTNCDCEQN